MNRSWNPVWSRRDWLTRQALTTAALLVPGRRLLAWARQPTASEFASGSLMSPEHALPAEVIAPGVMQTLALRAVEAAKSAGAQYADARVTRTVHHNYSMSNGGVIDLESEEVGLGVRALVNGYWGFAASPYWTPEEAVRLARAAVDIAKENAKGPASGVELGTVPAVTGSWATPIRIDPFTVPVEEKLDYIKFWTASAAQLGLIYASYGFSSFLGFNRQERVLATSHGTLITQTLFESGGAQNLQIEANQGIAFGINDIGWAGKGWELFLDAKVPEQMPVRRDEALTLSRRGSKPAQVGRYTIVCDGATIAALVGETVGVATQLDRALGYEANASGTSFLNDPLGMVGSFSLAPSLVTVTANRSAPGQLATVAWDDEGVVPPEFPLVKAGVVVDFQTTRELAGVLAPYYQKLGMPVQSRGCAGSGTALDITMQHMPNLALTPNASGGSITDLVANVPNGIFIEKGKVGDVDFQARNGLLGGQMREIRNGKLGATLAGGVILFRTLDLWKHVVAVGGAVTQSVVGSSRQAYQGDWKGQPRQWTSYSVGAAAATITGQAVIDPSRKA